MSNLLNAAITGNYEAAPLDQIEDADCIVSVSFGYSIEDGRLIPGRVNQSLGREAVVHSIPRDIPIIAPLEVEVTAREYSSGIWEGASFLDLQTQPRNSRDMLSIAKRTMAAEGLHKPLLLAQAHHIGRVAAEAVQLDMDVRCAPEMPTDFYPESYQWWTQNLRLWLLREIPMIAQLKMKEVLTTAGDGVAGLHTINLGKS